MERIGDKVCHCVFGRKVLTADNYTVRPGGRSTAHEYRKVEADSLMSMVEQVVTPLAATRRRYLRTNVQCRMMSGDGDYSAGIVQRETGDLDNFVCHAKRATLERSTPSVRSGASGNAL